MISFYKAHAPAPLFPNVLIGILILFACHLLSADGFAEESARSDKVYEPRFEIEELLQIPRIGNYVANDKGDVAWFERQGTAASIFIARAPNYTTEQLIRYENNEGLPITLIGFGVNDQLVYVRGRTGFNPTHTRFFKPRTVLSITQNQKTPKVLIANVDNGFSAPIISNDGAKLYYARGGEVKRLVLQGQGAGKPMSIFSVRGNVVSLKQAPVGRKLAFVSDRTKYRRGKYSFVGVYDFNQKSVTYMEPGLGIDQDIAWAPDGERLAFVRFGYEPKTWRFSDHKEGAPFDIMVANASTGNGRAIFTSEPGYGSRFNGFNASSYSGLGGSGSLTWLADDSLVFPYEKTGWKHLYTVSANGGSARQLTAGKFEVDRIMSSKDRRQLFYFANTEVDRARLGLYRLDVDEGLKAVRIPFEEAGGMPLSFGATLMALPGGGLVYEFAGGQTPGRLVVNPEGAAPKIVSTGPKPGHPITKNMPDPEVVEFKAGDGLVLQGILHKPAEIRGDRRHPVLVNSHGGSRIQERPVWMTDFFMLSSLDRYFAGKGYFVLSLNFRSGTGYGLDFREPKSYGGRGAGDTNDFIDAAKFLIKNYPEIDPDRMAIFGHSYGGHNVTNALARSDVYAAGISGAGVGDWVVEMEKDFNEVLQFNIPQRYEIEKRAYESSAISKVDEWGKEPLLLIHGDNDNSAAMQQSIELYHALRRRGIETEAVVFPGESHLIAVHENRVRYLEAIDRFLEKHLGAIE
ncbi:MAG: prolyl oligopeptidase family serine peptidase [Pseudomonadota bacterium]